MEIILKSSAFLIDNFEKILNKGQLASTLSIPSLHLGWRLWLDFTGIVIRIKLR